MAVLLQGLVIQILAATGVIHEGHFPYTVEQIEEAAQNFIICWEMLLFSFAFSWAFSAEEYNVARTAAAPVSRPKSKSKSKEPWASEKEARLEKERQEMQDAYVLPAGTDASKEPETKKEL